MTKSTRMGVAAGLCLLAMTAGTALAQTTTTEVKRFEVIAVDGNRIVVRGELGDTKELTVPPTFRLDVEGRPISVADLKPGMKGVATITTTTTVKPVYVTEVRKAKVVKATGNSIIISGPDGYKAYTATDLQKRNVTIIRDGRRVDINELRENDELTATIVTEKPPEILTERQVQATLAAAPRPAAGAAAPAAAPPPARTTAPPPAQKTAAAPGGTATPVSPAPATLPKTASPLPLLLVVSAALLAVGATLSVIRRRRRAV